MLETPKSGREFPGDFRVSHPELRSRGHQGTWTRMAEWVLTGKAGFSVFLFPPWAETRERRSSLRPPAP